MIGATAELYVSSNPNYDDTLSNATDTGIKLNFSLCVSPYTKKQVENALTDKNHYLFNKDAVLDSTTATLLDKYSPGWNNIFELCSAASNYVGSVADAAPDKTMRYFPSVYSQNIYDTIAPYSGGRAYVVFNKNDNLSFNIGSSGSFLGGIENNGQSGYFQPKVAIETYGYNAPYGTSWGAGTDYPWQFNGGWIIKCKDGYLCTSISVYDAKKAECRISVNDIWLNRDINFLNRVFLSGWKPFIPDTDPYIKGDKTGGGSGTGSGTGGGTGDFNGTTEDVNIPDLPTLSAVDTGLISLFNPSSAQLKTLANYLWGDAFDLSTWKKMFADPMDAILGLSIVPVNVPSSGSASLTIGNISTGITLPKVSSQYVTVDCGTINVNEYWGAYLDYSPYTQAEIYLPFIGIHPLTIDDIMGKPVHVVYHIDVLSGACCAYIKCGGSVLYSFVGQCSCSIPVTSNDWTNVINGAISIAASIGTMVATGGASAPMAIPGMAATATNSLKPTVEKSGAMGSMGGMLGVQNPYIILTRPKQAIPAYQNTFTGYPSFITKTLSECSGYTEVESIHLENVPATDGELEEINDLLKSGVII